MDNCSCFVFGNIQDACANTKIEGVQLAFEGLICELDQEHLKRLVGKLNAADEGVWRLQLIRNIRDAVENELKDKEATEQINLFNELSSFIEHGDGLPPYSSVCGEGKDGLTYVSLVRQIDASLKAEYPETEIVEAGQNYHLHQFKQA